MFRIPTGGTPRRSYLSGGMQRSVHLFKAHWSDHLHNKHKDVVKTLSQRRAIGCNDVVWSLSANSAVATLRSSVVVT